MKIWRPAFGLEGHYEISEDGIVRKRIEVNGETIYKERKPQLMNRGYLTLKISDNARGKHTRTIHSLVAEAFLGPRPNGFQVNHKDGNKQNNRADNLEWVTGSENMLHASRNGLRGRNGGGAGHGKPQAGDLNYNARLSEPEVVEIIQAIKSGNTGVSLARKYRVSTSLIQAIKKGKRWPHIPR